MGAGTREVDAWVEHCKVVDLKEENERLKDALRRIGNRVGSPMLSYAPTVAKEQAEEMIQDISSIVQEFIGKEVT